MSVFDNRRTRLRALIEQWGGPKPLSLKLGYNNASFLVQMAGPNPTREITERTARKIEQALNLPANWLDQVEPTPQQPQPVDSALMSRIVNVIAQTAEDSGIRLKPAALGEMVALVYGDYERAGSIRPEFIHSLFQLLR